MLLQLTRLSNLQCSLTKRLARKQRQECLLRLVKSIEVCGPRLDRALGDPLGHLLPKAVNVAVVDLVVPEDEALDVDTLAEDIVQVGDAVFLLGFLVVLRDLVTVVRIQKIRCE